MGNLLLTGWAIVLILLIVRTIQYFKQNPMEKERKESLTIVIISIIVTSVLYGISLYLIKS